MPNIVHTYDVIYDDQNECIIIVMEFIDGQSLRQILDQHGYLSVKEGLYIILKVVEAINSLHRLQHKIIHRDLKPENIMITKDFTEIKIIDFGISSVVNIHEHKALTSEDTLYGTYAYMSPDIYRMAQYVDSKKRKGEVVNDHAEMITEQFDFHSIGVILYETITGTKPF
jgi:serine/threonine-protein kinase